VPVRRVHQFPTELQRTLLRKLVVVDAAEALEDLRVPPGNRFEKLRGERAGPHSIRINDQWRAPPRAVFGTTERFWLNLQARYDLETQRDALGARLVREVRIFERAS
jgi:RelE-like toxin of type II toxin-antitoxin system HigB